MKLRFPTLMFCLFLACTTLLLNSCKEDEDPADEPTVYEFSPDAVDNQEKVQEALILMEPNDIIRFAAGEFQFTNTLSLSDIDNVTIEGAGRGLTTLSFAGQTAGAEGLKINNSNWLLMQDFTIMDTEGDAIKVTQSDGVSFVNVGVEWSGVASEDNGAYGLYPVTCTNVLIDNCYVRGASDAGVYVGQSNKVIVRNSSVEENVAGIEIENTIGADVYGNTAQNNTGGILVFNLPNLPIGNGYQTRVFNNTLIKNDHRNFAPEGNIVGQVPPGTGVMILSYSQVEVFNNTITDNNVMGVGIINYDVLEFFDPSLTHNDASYDPLPKNIYIHDNVMTGSGIVPDETNSISLLLNSILLINGHTFPDVMFDGITDPNLEGADRICIVNNGDASFLNVDAPNDFAGITDDISPHDCTHTGLPEVVVDAPTL